LGVSVGGTSAVFVGVAVGGTSGVFVGRGVFVIGGKGVALAVAVNVGRRVAVGVAVGVFGPLTICRPTEHPSILKMTRLPASTMITVECRFINKSLWIERHMR